MKLLDNGIVQTVEKYNNRRRMVALSNWDTLAIDHNNNSINGVIKSKMGVTVRIYKNWLYIEDNIAW